MDEGDLQRIRLVTERFHELHGLSTAVVGGGILASVSLWGALSAWGGPPPSFLLGCGIALGLGSAPLASRYYRATFGEVSATVMGRVRAVAFFQLAMGGFLADGVAYDLGWAGPNVMLAVLGSYSLYVVVRDWPSRTHHLAGVLACAAALLVWSPAPQSTAFAYALMATGMIVTGLLDHRLLVLAMPGPAPEERSGNRLGHSDVAGLRLGHGLIRMGVGLGLSVGIGVHLVFIGSPVRAFSVLLLLQLALMLGIMFALVVQGFCDWRYGVVRVAKPNIRIPIALLSAAVFDNLVLNLEFPSVFALTLAASSLWVVYRDWPFRRHYLLTAIAGLVAAIQHIGVRTETGFAQWLGSFMLLMGVALFIEGLCDYRLFVKTVVPLMRPRIHANTI